MAIDPGMQGLPSPYQPAGQPGGQPGLYPSTPRQPLNDQLDDENVANQHPSSAKEDQAAMSEAPEAVCKRVKADRDWAYGSFSDYYDRCEDFYKQYRMIADASTDETRSNTFVPYTFTMVENVVARIMSAYFSKRPYARVEAPEVMSDPMIHQFSRLAEARLQSQMDRGSFYFSMLDYVKAGSVFGTSYLKSFWKTEKGYRVTRPRQLDANGLPSFGAAQAVEDLIYDGPDGDVFVPGQILVDPTSGPDLQKADFVIEETWKPLDYLQRMEERKVYENTMNLKAGEGTPVFPGLQRMAWSSRATDGAQIPENRKMIKVWEAWYRNGWVYTIANETVLLKRRKNPFLHRRFPYVPFHFIPVMGEPIGLGIPEILEFIQAELNTTRNQRTDNVNFLINKILKYRRGAFGDPENELKNKPGAMWGVERMDDVEWMRTPEINSSAFTSEEMLKQDAQSAVGLNDLTLGNTGAAQAGSATESSILAEQSASRLKLVIMTFGASFRQICETWNALDAQYMPSSVQMAVRGIPEINNGQPSIVQLTPEEIAQPYRFNVLEAANAIDRQAEGSKKAQVYAELKQLPFVDLAGMARWFAESMGAPELAQFIGTPQPAPVDPNAPPQGGPQPGPAQPAQPAQPAIPEQIPESPIPSGPVDPIGRPIQAGATIGDMVTQ